jgi:hypothetical protein
MRARGEEPGVADEDTLLSAPEQEENGEAVIAQDRRNRKKERAFVKTVAKAGNKGDIETESDSEKGKEKGKRSGMEYKGVVKAPAKPASKGRARQTKEIPVVLDSSSDLEPELSAVHQLRGTRAFTSQRSTPHFKTPRPCPSPHSVAHADPRWLPAQDGIDIQDLKLQARLAGRAAGSAQEGRYQLHQSHGVRLHRPLVSDPSCRFPCRCPPPACSAADDTPRGRRCMDWSKVVEAIVLSTDTLCDTQLALIKATVNSEIAGVNGPSREYRGIRYWGQFQTSARSGF